MTDKKMHDDMKALTIIVPSYNMEKYLAKCCESVVLEPELMECLEVIVVNDGSTDKTSEIAHSFERRYPGTFRVIDKENGHYGSCVNRGLAEAKGEFVKLLDADDTFDNKVFADYMRFLVGGVDDRSLAEVDLVLTDHSDVDCKGTVTGRTVFKGKANVLLGPKDFVETKMELFPSMSTFRTQMLRDIGYRQTEGALYTDLEWGTYPMRGIRKIWYRPGAVYRYLHGREGQSISAAVVGRNLVSMEKVLARMVAELSNFEGDASVAEFFQRKLKSVAETLYYSYFVFAPIGEVNDGFARADEIVKANSSLYNTAGGFSFSRRFRYPYVSRWRKSGRLPLSVIFLARVYSRLANGLFKRAARR